MVGNQQRHARRDFARTRMRTRLKSDVASVDQEKYGPRLVSMKLQQIKKEAAIKIIKKSKDFIENCFTEIANAHRLI